MVYTFYGRQCKKSLLMSLKHALTYIYDNIYVILYMCVRVQLSIAINYHGWLVFNSEDYTNIMV